MAVTIDLFAALAADDPPVHADGERHDILFRPSFHPETLLTLDLGPRSTVRLRAFATSLWTSLALHRLAVDNAANPDEAAAIGPPRLPQIHDARAALTPARAEQLRAALARAAPGLAAPDDRRGLDGINIDVQLHAVGAPPRRHSVWSPDPEHPHHAYFAILYALASELLRDEQAQRRLEQLHGYLGLGLPAVDRGGDPRRLQIFGRLSSSDEHELAGLLAIPAPTDPVVVDMRNFEGMGTLLYPLFREFSRRPGATGWAVSASARRQLREARVPDDQMREDLADAVLLVTIRDVAR